MKTTAALIAALGLTTAAAAPAFAAQHEMDIASLTCYDFQEMDEAGKMSVAEALVAELESMENADAAMIEIESVCDEENSEDTTVLTALTSGSSD